MERHRVSPVTVSRALAELVAEGLVVTRPGAGAFRAEPRGEAPRPADTSWQEIALSAEPAGDQVPRSVDASGVLATLATPPPAWSNSSAAISTPICSPNAPSAPPWHEPAGGPVPGRGPRSGA